MPELPEVETVKNGLKPFILNQHIKNVDIFRYDLRRTAPNNSIALLKNQNVTSLQRRSKYLYIHLSNAHTLIIHLGMSGTLTCQNLGTETRKHDHFIIYLPEIQIHFNDPRRFGFFDVQLTSILSKLPYIENLGVEPLDKNFTVEYLFNIMRIREKPVKNLLMDNHLIVGIGNIYACETLFDAQISPFIASKCVSHSQIMRLYASIIDTLKKAIKSGGSPLKDYTQVYGKPGYFQHNFKVYGREKMPCSVCHKNISKITQAGRSTFYCPSCQKV
jgi:formamidopyrimidine-DNA glycosylase